MHQSKLSKDFQTVLRRFQQVERDAAEKSREYVIKARAMSTKAQTGFGFDEDDHQQEQESLLDYERK